MALLEVPPTKEFPGDEDLRQSRVAVSSPWRRRRWKERVHTADPLRHPDLARLGRALRDQLDETLDAEQHAARAAARRRRSLRDALLEAEDRRAAVRVSCIDGQLYRGTVVAVGTDHVALADGEGAERLVALAHVVTVQVS